MNPVQKLFEKDGYNLTLRTIYFRDCQASLSADFEPLLAGQPLAGQLRKEAAICVRTEFADADGSMQPGLAFLTRFDFQYVHESEPERVVASVSAIIATCYYLKSDTKLDEAGELAWGESSALFHAWPYWREYAHSALARLNLPVTLMPMLDIQSAISNATEAAASAADKRSSKPQSASPAATSKKAKSKG